MGSWVWVSVLFLSMELSQSSITSFAESSLLSLYSPFTLTGYLFYSPLFEICPNLILLEICASIQKWNWHHWRRIDDWRLWWNLHRRAYYLHSSLTRGLLGISCTRVSFYFLLFTKSVTLPAFFQMLPYRRWRWTQQCIVLVHFFKTLTHWLA